MSKKGKGKGKGAKKGKNVAEEVFEEKLAEVDRAFYELTIQDAKKKIGTLRAHIQNLIVSNDNAEEELRDMKENKNKMADDLEKKINEIENNIAELRSESAQLTFEYNTEKRKADETISDLINKKQAMQEQLSAEIKRLNGKLNACEELSRNWDEWMLKYMQRADDLAQKEKNSEEALIAIGKKSIFENNMLKETLLEKVTLAGEEFTAADATSTTDFNMRLIRENIALTKNIDLLWTSNNELDKQMKVELELYEINKAAIPKLNEKSKRLIEESEEKLLLIETLMKQVKNVKKELIASMSYREQNVSFKEFQMCARFRRMKLKKATYAVGQQIQLIDRESNLYDYLIQQYNLETRKVLEHLEYLRFTIERSLFLMGQEPINFAGTADRIRYLCRERNNMLATLVELFHIDISEWDPDQRASIITIDDYDKLTRFDTLFKKEAPSLSSLMELCVRYIDSEDELGSSSSITEALKAKSEHDLQKYKVYIPAQRPLGRNYIFDVETGTSLYISSDHGDPELKLAEEQGALDEEEEESSNESWSAASDDKNKEKESTQADSAKRAERNATISLPQMPPGTIIDVTDAVSEEELEEDQFAVENVEEDEEYNINLFY